MKVKDAMTKKTIILRPSDKMEKVLKVLSKNNISGCPVVDSKDNIMGIVGQTDVIKFIDVYDKVNKGNITPFIDSLVFNKKLDMKKLKDVEVRDFLKKGVITIEYNKELYDAARIMNKHDIERLPVVKSKKLVGIITRKDVIRALGNMKKIN